VRPAPILAGLLAVALLVAAGPAPAAPAEAEARARFEHGVELIEQRAWAEALAEFALSRRLHPTWKAAKNAAACLTELGRYDEALDLLEALPREFPELPAQAREDVAAAAAQLQGRVGVLAIEEGQPGVAVFVDDRYRGELPAAASLRVVPGAHVVRLGLDGYEPVEAPVVVAPGQRAVVLGRLRALDGAGRLRVTEARGLALEVVVDGRGVGRAPWEGTVAEGDHVVWLRGPEALGTQPSVVRVAARGKVTTLLTAEPLAARASIAASPAEAALALDGVPVGAGPWEGRLRAAGHRVEVSAAGFVPARRDVRLAPGEEATVRVTLERDPFAPLWRRAPRLTVELDAAAFVAPGLGGDVSRGCVGSCAARPALGGRALLRAGVELRSGLGLGLTAGALAADQRTTGRPAAIAPVGLSPTPGTVDDTRKLRAFVGGAWAGFTLGERAVLRLRLGAGALVGSLGDSRTGHFQPSAAPAYSIGPVGDAPRAAFVYVEPELRAGLRVSQHVELTAAVSALVLVDVAHPTWDAAHPVNAASDGVAFFAQETLASPVSVAIVPGVAARYEF
jgi:hypothetical protein